MKLNSTHKFSPQLQQSVSKQIPQWPSLIAKYRKSLKMNKRQFGDLFGVSSQAVSYWETGRSQAPYQVTWLLYRKLQSSDKVSIKASPKTRLMGNDREDNGQWQLPPQP